MLGIDFKQLYANSAGIITEAPSVACARNELEATDANLQAVFVVVARGRRALAGVVMEGSCAKAWPVRAPRLQKSPFFMTRSRSSNVDGQLLCRMVWFVSNGGVYQVVSTYTQE